MNYILTLTLLVVSTLTFGQSKIEIDSLNINPNYDKELADKLGGDDYGMKSYFLVILKTWTNTTTDKEFISESFRGHLNNINRMVEEGKLIIAGPLGKNENNYRGIFILNDIKSIEEAKELLQTDPAIKTDCWTMKFLLGMVRLHFLNIYNFLIKFGNQNLKKLLWQS